ncbi:MAG: tRNA (N(6)-L-threonylcarbamoyladenosine(37)-C(2))-methylthiotransferase [Archaeoglobaceae archaeon]
MKVAIETYGCTMNQADSDVMRGLISRYFTLCDVEEADVVVVNSCGVVDFTERKIIRRIRELKELGKKVVLAGCLTRISGEAVALSDAAVSPDNVDRIVEAVVASLDGGFFALERRNLDKASLSAAKCRLGGAIAIVSIAEGCVGRCSFCVTRLARGRLRSFSIDAVVEEVRRAVAEGYKEIQLTSQDTGAYGLDKGKPMLPELLRRISEIDGEFRVRVGMMNPQHARAMLEELIEAYESEKIYKFLHVPVQSGDDEVLKAMMRDHTVEDYVEVVREFRRAFDDVVVSTDIIVGFPTEDEEAFWRSVELVRETKPDIVNITRFSPRPGTPAAKLKDIPGWIKKERSRVLTRVCKEVAAENNSKFVGSRMRVLVTRHGKGETMLSRSDSYRPVIVRNAELGEFLEVRIRGYTHAYLVA